MARTMASALTALLFVTIAASGLVDASKCTNVVKVWGACGGLSGAPKGVKGVAGSWAGYCCAKGTTCVTKDKYYSQCIPAPAPSPAPAIKCAGGKQLVGGKCVGCPTGTWSSDGANKCSTCPAGTQSPKGYRNYCEQCSYNEYSRAGHACKPCPVGTYTMETGSKTCKVCKTKMALDAPGRDCTDYYICEPGKRTTYNYCKGDNECYWSDHACCTDRRGEPLVCNGSVIPHAPKPASPKPVKCAGGQQLVGGKCVACPVNTWASEGANKCTPCPAGTQSPKGYRNFCEPCTYNEYSRAGHACKPCPVGTYAMQTGSTSCTACKKKMALDALGPTCSDYYICEPGKTTMLKYCKENQCYNSYKFCCENVSAGVATSGCQGSVLA